MGRKKLTFQDKIAKSKMKKNPECPTCGEERIIVKTIKPYRTDKGSIRFREEVLRVCSCNKEEVYG